MGKLNDIELLKNIPSEITMLFTKELANYLVIYDGKIVFTKLEKNLKKLTISNIKEATISNNKLFEQYPALTDLKSVNNGLFIEAPRNYSEDSTLHIFYVQEDKDLDINTLIILNQNAEFNYFEYLYNKSQTHINFVSNSIVKENARLKYVGISNFNEKANACVTRNSYISRYGKSLYSIAEINDANIESNTNIFLNDKYASATSKVVAITSNNQKAKFRQLLEHNSPDTEGFIENYGVANNQSSLMFEGVGKINKNMKRSVARQQNKGIVLGEFARLDANPLLLIDEYDVEAAHGAAIGKIDEEQLYYLMSRGLTLKNAERLIISGFLSPVIEMLTTEKLIENFVSIVERKTL